MGDDDYLMNETRRKPTTGRQSPSLFDKWHGIFYMPSRIDEAGHTKAFDYPVAEHWGESQRTERSLVGFEPTSAHTYESDIQRSTTRYIDDWLIYDISLYDWYMIYILILPIYMKHLVTYVKINDKCKNGQLHYVKKKLFKRKI